MSRSVDVPKTLPPGFTIPVHNGQTRVQHVIYLARSASHVQMGIEAVTDEYPGPMDYCDSPALASVMSLSIPVSTSPPYAVTFEHHVPPEIRDIIYNYMIDPPMRKVTAPPVSNYCIRSDYHHVHCINLRTNL